MDLNSFCVIFLCVYFLIGRRFRFSSQFLIFNWGWRFIFSVSCPIGGIRSGGSVLSRISFWILSPSAFFSPMGSGGKCNFLSSTPSSFVSVFGCSVEEEDYEEYVFYVGVVVKHRIFAKLFL